MSASGAAATVKWLVKDRHLSNPQDLNRYVYVASNPLAFMDPDGEEKIRIIIRTFIPQKKITFPMPVKGDGRNVGDKGTSRTTQEILVETDRRKSRDALLEHKKDTGISQGAGVIFIPNPVGGGMVPAPGIVVRKATGDSIKATAEHHKHRDGAVYINAKASESYPGVPSPAIDYDLHINVMDSGNGKITVEMVGQHDGFPAYEVFAVREGDTEEQHIYSHDPRDENQTGLSLAGGGEFKASSRVDLHRPNKKKP